MSTFVKYRIKEVPADLGVTPKEIWEERTGNEGYDEHAPIAIAD